MPALTNLNTISADYVKKKTLSNPPPLLRESWQNLELYQNIVMNYRIWAIIVACDALTRAIIPQNFRLRR